MSVDRRCLKNSYPVSTISLSNPMKFCANSPNAARMLAGFQADFDSRHRIAHLALERRGICQVFPIFFRPEPIFPAHGIPFYHFYHRQNLGDFEDLQRRFSGRDFAYFSKVKLGDRHICIKLIFGECTGCLDRKLTNEGRCPLPPDFPENIINFSSLPGPQTDTKEKGI